MTDPPTLSITEYAVLGVLAPEARHGFALAKELEGGSELGRVFTVRRPLVYRALDRLVEAECAETVSTEPGTAGPSRVIHRIAPQGRSELQLWLSRPVEHVRDLRIEFLLKVALIQRCGDSPFGLICAQRTALEATFAALDDAVTGDHVELWRHHSAAAAAAYLADLERRYR